jgi:indoleamine 2,3-dioxygenase
MGGTDETWFFTATLGVELAGAPVLAALHDAANASANDDLDALERHLTVVADTMPSLTAALARMREWCDPHIFYHRLRPFLAGWPAPGVVYDGVSPDPVMLAGGSAGQSSLVQALDAGLGIVHGPTAGPFLDHMRDYMPPAHRRYLTDLAATSRIRHVADTRGPTGLTEAYNAAVDELELFRRRHLALAM